MKVGGVKHLIAWFARSLEASDYDVLRHPSFDDYARGVMASNARSRLHQAKQKITKTLAAEIACRARAWVGLEAAKWRVKQ